MNTLVQNEYQIVEMTEALTIQLLDSLSEDALTHVAAANNPSLGALFANQIALQAAYIQSFRTFSGDFHTIAPVAIESNSIEGLRKEFPRLHDELKSKLESFSDEEFTSRIISHEGGFQISLATQVQFYRESILIFSAKVSVYLRSIGVTFPDQWTNWIG